jgi:predicted dehydrogenase/nucleoside-diphosphate-sugar epimerase
MPLRFVILGGGAVTTEFYLPALHLNGRLGDAVVVDPDAEQVRANATAFGDARFQTGDYAAFLDRLPPASDVPECIVVALPNHLHVDAVRRALAKDRHVLCEKPLALLARECTELRELAASRRRLLKVAMSRRYLAALRLTREIVRGGEIGEVRAIEVHDRTPFLWRPRSFTFFAREAGGVLADMGVHYLDYVATLVGPLTPVGYTDDARGGNESTLEYRLRAADDVPVEILLSRIHQTGGWLTVTCARGEIRVEKSRENAAIVTPTGRPSRLVQVEHPFSDPLWPSDFHGSFAQMLRDMEDVIASETRDIADATDAEHTVALIEWAYAARTASCAPCPPTTARSRPALVTGATGFIGGHLVERLTSDGAEVRVTARSPAKCANVTRFHVDLRPTDLLDPRSVRAAVAGVGVVYHLAYGTDGGDPSRITIEGTRNVVEAAIAAGAECVVVLSTMYVFGFPQGDRPVDETFSYRPFGGEYGESKAKIERWCLERAKNSGGTRIVVLNPTCVFGPAGGAYTCLPVDLAHAGQFCWIDGGSGSANYVYVDNLIAAILLAAATPAAHGERFIVNDGTVTWRDFIGPFVAPLGADVPSYTATEFSRLPRYGGPFRLADLVRAAASAAEVRAVAKRSALVRHGFALTNRVFPRPPVAGDQLAAHSRPQESCVKGDSPTWLAQLYGPHKARFSADKARRELGWTPRVDLAEAQAATLAWLVENGRLPNGKVEC